jgi:hypothetical protein
VWGMVATAAFSSFSLVYEIAFLALAARYLELILNLDSP